MKDLNPPPPAVAASEAEPTSSPDIVSPDGSPFGSPRGATKSMRDPSKYHPSFLFLAIVSILTFACDFGTKSWAAHRLDKYPPVIRLWKSRLTFALTHNPYGAWGSLHDTSENVRGPFFILVGISAITFLLTLYYRLNSNQRALKWGLPILLGGAVGNLYDRVRYGSVIDFIDYQADWVRKMNVLLGHVFPGNFPTDHWPTYNVADVAIYVGVGLMIIDLFRSQRDIAREADGPGFPRPCLPGTSNEPKT